MTTDQTTPSQNPNEITFGDVILELERRDIEKHGRAKTVKSDMTTLNNFMDRYNLTRDDSIAGHLGLPWEIVKARIDDYLSTTTYVNNSKSVYRSRMKRLNLIALSMICVGGSGQRTLAENLNLAIDNARIRNPALQKRDIAHSAGMSRSMLGTWTSIHVSCPRATEKNVARAIKLESTLGLQAGSLLNKLTPIARNEHKSIRTINKERFGSKDGVGVVEIQYRAIQLPPKIDILFRDVILFKTGEYKMCNAGGDELLTGKYPWRVTQGDAGIPATAKIWLMGVQTYVGWLMLPKTIDGAKEFIENYCDRMKKSITAEGRDEIAPLFVGCGLSADEVHPIHLVDPEYHRLFNKWLRLRNHQNRVDYIHNARALINIKNGFLTQQVEYVWDHPKLGLTPVSQDDPDWMEKYQVQQGKWRATCSKWSAILSDLVKNVPKKADVIREKLKPMLVKGDIFEMLRKMIAKHVEYRPVARLKDGVAGQVFLAIWIRDQFLLRTLVSNPLRHRNYCEMTYRADNSGNLRQCPERGWRLVFQPEEFKNQRGVAKGIYDVGIPKDLWPLIEEYLFKARPVLMRNGNIKTDRVFLSKDGAELNDGRLSHVVFSLTARFGGFNVKSVGIRMHAFRHLIATAWLREHRYDYYTVAKILHDDLETVMKVYAHDEPDDVLVVYNKFLALPPMPAIDWRMAA